MSSSLRPSTIQAPLSFCGSSFVLSCSVFSNRGVSYFIVTSMHQQCGTIVAVFPPPQCISMHCSISTKRNLKSISSTIAYMRQIQRYFIPETKLIDKITSNHYNKYSAIVEISLLITTQLNNFYLPSYQVRTTLEFFT